MVVYILFETYLDKETRVVDVFANEDDAKTRRKNERDNLRGDGLSTFQYQFTIEPHKVIE